jgi:hypothetical protein
MANRFNLQHPAVQIVALKFNSRKNKKYPQTYDVIYKLLLNPRNSFTDIAEILGITSEAVDQMVQRYFAKFLPTELRTGKSRRKLGVKLNQHKLSQTDSDKSPAGTLARLARRAGLKIKRIIREGRLPNKHLLYINEVLCYVRTRRTCSSMSEGRLPFYNFGFQSSVIGKTKKVCLLIPEGRKIVPYIFDSGEIQSNQLNIPKPGVKKKKTGPSARLDFEKHKYAWEIFLK